ncbi:MAG: ATP-binding protein [Caldilinea sp. CFX5]|nr:ATP-binding protein [Caldilinea sp. CFX5]
MFVDREQELAFLNNVLTRQRRNLSELILLYGRRRVGKTVLLRHWAEQAQTAYTYWAAEKEPAALQRRKLYARLLGVTVNRAPLFESWSELWRAAAELLGDRRHILILDEVPYAAESDPAMLSALQHAWDQYFKDSAVLLVLCGSHVRTMETLFTRQSPLFGRMTGQWHLQPLPFAALRAFFPNWSAEERVAAYAIVGGIPAYLEWLNPKQTLVQNILEVLLSPGSMFIAEPQFLLYDEVREPQSYLAILKALGAGYRTLSEISNASLISKTHLSAYLATLQSLQLVERRVPVTLAPNQRRQSRQGRYHLSDPYFRFYFRFFDPVQDLLTVEPARVLELVKQGLRAFVGQTAFELLAQEWVRQQGRKGQLPFTPESVGSHWSRTVQVDVVGINWQRHELLLGECKWTGEPLDRQVIRELIEEKAAKVRRDLAETGTTWQLHFAFFARAGFTDAARREAAAHQAMLVDLAKLDQALHEVG